MLWRITGQFRSSSQRSCRQHEIGPLLEHDAQRMADRPLRGGQPTVEVDPVAALELADNQRRIGDTLAVDLDERTLALGRAAGVAERHAPVGQA